MQQIISTIRWLDQNYPTNSFSQGKVKNKYQLVYRAVIANKQITDIETSELLYGIESESDSKYRMFKSRFNSKLLDEVLAIPAKDFNNVLYQKSPTSKNAFECYRNFNAANFLRIFGLSVFETSKILEQTLKKAIKGENWGLSLVITKDLKSYYGRINIDRTKYEKYKAKYFEIKEIFELEEASQDLYCQLQQIKFYQNKSISKSDLKTLEIQLKQNVERCEPYGLYFINYYNYNSQFLLFNILNKNEGEVIEKALNFFKAKKDFRLVGFHLFLLRKGVYQLQNSKIEEAQKTFKQFQNLNITSMSFSYMYYNYYLSFCLILKGNYIECMRKVDAYIKRKEFVKFKNQHIQTWYLLEGYIHALYFLENKNEKTPEGIRKFRIKRFLNETPEMTKDKEGLNVQIQLIEFLHLILKNDFEKLEVKANALKQYAVRNLKSKDYKRTKLFISLIQKIPKYAYHIKQLSRKSEKVVSKLNDLPFVPGNEKLAIELVPYEQIWKAIFKYYSR